MSEPIQMYKIIRKDKDIMEGGMKNRFCVFFQQDDSEVEL